jgi:Polysaccharide deacetylase
MRVPILTYHACNISGNSYDTNDQIALAEDLRLIARKGWRIIPLRSLLNVLRENSGTDLSRCLVITCDDGTLADIQALEFPGHGIQPGLLGVLQSFVAESPKMFPELELSCFVIADPYARAVLDRECLFNRGWMGEDIWKLSQASGLLRIECHSWDHNHSALTAEGPDGMVRGDFFTVNNDIRARHEIDRSMEYLNARLGDNPCRVFAYPYAQVNEFLRDDYLPTHAARLGLYAAVGGEPAPVTVTSNVWALPRYICGLHWKSLAQLEAILDDCI